MFSRALLVVPVIPALSTVVGCEYVAQIGDKKAELGGRTDAGSADANAEGADSDANDGATAGEGAAPSGTCLFDQALVPATINYGSPTVLARVSTPAGKRWATMIGAPDRLVFNEVDDAGMLAHPQDVVLDQIAVQGDFLAPPRMVPLASGWLVAYGRYNASPAQAVTTVRRFEPATAAFVGAEASGLVATATSLPRVTSAALDDTGSRLLVPTILSSADLDPMRVELFNATPERLRVDDTLPDSRGADCSWAPDAERFGMATLTANGGALQTFDRDMNQVASFVFATPQLNPPWGAAEAPPAITSVGRQFYVAWVRLDSAAKSVVINGFDALSGALRSPTSILVSSQPATNAGYPAFPKLLIDGQTLLVTWIEMGTDFAGDIHAQRFDLDLSPVGEEMCVTCDTATRASGEYALAGDGAGRLAVEFYSTANSRHYLVAINCTTP